MKTIRLFLIVTLLAVALAGCIAPPPVEEAQQEVDTAESVLCASIAAYVASLEALEQVSADTTVEEYNALKEAAYQAYANMAAAWVNVQEAEVDLVESAVAEFQTALDEVSPDATLAEAAESIAASAATVKLSVAQLDEVVCASAASE